jgi:thiol-disulfide isomerase/thioredoxin
MEDPSMIKLKVKTRTSNKRFLSTNKTRHLLLVNVIASFFLIQTTSSEAQVSSYQDMIIPVPIPHPVTSLLRSKKVQRELGLSAAEINEVRKVVSEFDLPIWRLRDLPPQERNEAVVPLINQLKSKLARTLSDRQTERLNQLVLQASGIEVILEPEVSEKLNLSPEQTIKIRTLLKILYSKISSLQNNPELGSAPERVTYLQNLQAETHRSILAILNSYQQNSFTLLMGRPFNFSKIQSIACKAPEFENETWINSSPVKLFEQRGKVTVVHFYAFGCGNCIRSLPYYNDWYRLFPKSSFSIIAIHRPETQQERSIEKVKEKATQAGMEYPIAIDNESLAWDSWANNIWPSIYLIDKNGFVRYWWYGELNYQGAESEKLLRKKIRELINEPSAVEYTALNR